MAIPSTVKAVLFIICGVTAVPCAGLLAFDQETKAFVHNNIHFPKCVLDENGDVDIEKVAERALAMAKVFKPSENRNANVIEGQFDEVVPAKTKRRKPR